MDYERICNAFSRQNISEGVSSLESLNKQDVIISVLHKIKRTTPVTTVMNRELSVWGKVERC